ncbi:MAG: ribonuclease Z [Bacteroidales bacterium]|nr:ribonuclease Z [Bacteroidales bacterium]
MSFELTVLGSSSALPTSKRFPTAHVLNVHERFYLIDCGEGTQMQLRKYKISLGKIHTIFISHLHGDHVLGLFGLLSTFNLLGREAPLTIYAHADLVSHLEFLRKTFANTLSFQIIHKPIRSKENGIIFEDKNIIVESVPLRHRIPTMGFLFKEKPHLRNLRKESLEKYKIPIKERLRIKEGEDFVCEDGTRIPNSLLTIPPFKSRTYAYITDTRPVEKIAERILNFDLLYHEATFLEKDAKLAKQTYHSTAKQAAQIAKNARVRRLLLGHFSSRYKDQKDFLDEAGIVFPNTQVVEDGDKFLVEKQREEA